MIPRQHLRALFRDLLHPGSDREDLLEANLPERPAEVANCIVESDWVDGWCRFGLKLKSYGKRK